MTVTLTPELETFVNEKVNSGAYNSPDEMIERGLLRLKEDDIMQSVDLDEVRRSVQASRDSYARGEYTEYDREGLNDYAEKVLAESKRKWEAKQSEGIK